MSQSVDAVKIKIEKKPIGFQKKPFVRSRFFNWQNKAVLLLDKMISFIIGSLVFLMPLFFLPWTYEAYEFNKLYLIFSLSSIAFIFWLLKMLLKKEVRFIRTPLDFSVILFLLVMILSTIFSVDKISSLLGFYGRFSDSLILFLSLGMMYFVMINNFKTQNLKLKAITQNSNSNSNLKNSNIQYPISSPLLNLFLFSSFIAIIIGLFSVFGKFIIPLDIAQARTFNPAAGSLEGLAVFAAMIISLVVGLFLQKKKSILFYYFIVLLLGVSLLFLIVVNFTPSWIVLLAGMGFFIFLKAIRKTIPSILSLILIIISFLFLFTPATGEKISSSILNSTPSDSLLERGRERGGIPQEIILNKEVSNEIVKKSFFIRPSLGSGLGTFSYDFSLYRPREFNQNRFWNLRFDKANSEISERLATTGTVGIFTWLFLLLTFFWILIKNKGDKGDILSVAMAVFALFIGTFFYYQNITLRFSLWFFLALGMCFFASSGKFKEINFPLRENSEKTNAFRWLILIAVFFAIASFFMLGKFYYADVFYKKGIVNQDISQAIENYQRAVKFNPYQFNYRIVLARAYLQKINADLKKPEKEQDNEVIKQEISKAINQAKKAVELSPNNVFAKETLAAIYRDISGIARGADEWALKSFKEASALEPSNPILLTEIGKAYVVLENNEKAIEYFQKAIFFKENYLDAYLYLSLVYEKQGKQNLAVKELKKVAQPESLANVEILYQLGRICYNQKKIDEAILYFQKVLKFFPNHSNALYSLGVAYQRQNKKDEALKMFERVLQLNPGNEDVKTKIEELE